MRNSCNSNLWPKQISILLNIEFKILRKRPGDKAFRVSFKFPVADEIKDLSISIDFQVWKHGIVAPV